MSDNWFNEAGNKIKDAGEDLWENDTARRGAKAVGVAAATAATGPVGFAVTAGPALWSEHDRDDPDDS